MEDINKKFLSLIGNKWEGINRKLKNQKFLELKDEYYNLVLSEIKLLQDFIEYLRSK